MNKFAFAVEAQDKFSKVFRNLNNEASKALRPIESRIRGMRDLSRQMHLPALGRGFTDLARTAQTLSGSLGSAVGPLGSLVGLGAGGGIVALAAAMTAMGAAWAGAGAQVLRGSKALGIGTDELQRLQAAGKQAGLSEGEVSQGLSGAAMFAHSVRWNSDPNSVILARKLGLDVGDRNGPVDMNALLTQMSRALSRIPNAQTRAGVAEGMGVGSLLPMLMGGPDQLKSYFDKARKLGAVQSGGDLGEAKKLEESLDRLGVAAAGARNRIASSYGPSLARSADFFADMLSPTNPEDLKPPTPAQLAALKRLRLFGGGKRRGVAPFYIDTPEGQAQVLDDVIRGNAQFNSDATRRRVLNENTLRVEVNVNAPPGTTVRATSTDPATPVRVRRSMEGKQQ